MPWAENNSLPDSVKVLPEAAQSVFRFAANSALKDGKAEEDAMQIGWGAVKQAGWSKSSSGQWVKANEDQETYAMDMEIFATGKWNGDEYLESDLQDIVQNFNELKETVKPFLKLGGVDPHSDLVHQPAIGWIEKLRIERGRIIATVKDIPRIVFEAIKRKLYRRVSSELYVGFKAQDGKKRNFVLRAVALIGATVPAVSTLKDLTTYLEEKLQAEKVLVFGFDSDDEKIVSKEENNNMDTEVIKKFEEQIAAEKAAREAAEAELKTFKEKQQEASMKQKISEVKAFCENQVKAGKMTPFIRDMIFPEGKDPVLVFTDDQQAVLMLPFEVMQKVFESASVIDFSEKGAAEKLEDRGDKNPGEVLDIKAKKLIADGRTKDYSEACRIVLSEDEELAKDYAADKGKTVTIR